jgi:hypothetical protein
MSGKAARRKRGAKAPLKIVIRSDGQVALGTLTPEMLELGLAIAPQDARLGGRALANKARRLGEKTRAT